MKGLCLLVFAGSVLVANACQFPPSLWCSSEQIANQCKVYGQCKAFVWTEIPNAPKVNLELYYESLCPDCKNFIQAQLNPTYQKVGSVMNITLVPYGNAEEKKTIFGHYEFRCQHGVEECIGNVIETCAINLLQKFDSFFPFISCMESSSKLPAKAAKTCAEKLGLPLDHIMSCANSTEGSNMEHEMAVKTEALVPKHTYVPWIVLNGVHTEKINDEAMEHLLKLVCDTYKGPKPSECQDAELKFYLSSL